MGCKPIKRLWARSRWHYQWHYVITTEQIECSHNQFAVEIISIADVPLSHHRRVVQPSISMESFRFGCENEQKRKRELAAAWWWIDRMHVRNAIYSYDEDAPNKYVIEFFLLPFLFLSSVALDFESINPSVERNFVCFNFVRLALPFSQTFVLLCILLLLSLWRRRRRQQRRRRQLRSATIIII